MSREKLKISLLPHPVVLIFGIIILVAVMSYIVPSGAFDREIINGKSRVVPGTFTFIDDIQIGFFDIFRAIGLGFQTASEIIFAVFAGAIMFGILDKSGMVENVIGALIKKIGLKRRQLIVVLSTFIFGLLGVAVGYENNIAIVPVAAVLSIAIGGDLLLAAGISVGAITVGFGLSPINPYTVGIGHQIAEMQIFSGAILRSLLCLSALGILAGFNVRYLNKLIDSSVDERQQPEEIKSISLSKNLQHYSINKNDLLILSIFLSGLAFMLYGVFNLDWFINEIAAVFLIVAVVAGVSSRMSGHQMGETIYASLSMAAPGAFMVGFAATIRVLLEMGQLTDTFSFYLSNVLEQIPTSFTAIAMTISQSFLNFLIPSGSGQALATLPIMIPLGDLLGLTRQCTIMAFQIGDGVTNLINPTLGGLIAMLALLRVPLDKWITFIFPVVIYILILSWTVLTVAVWFGWN